MTVHSGDVHNSPKTGTTHRDTTEGRARTVRSILATEYYSAMKRNNTLPHATVWMNPGHMKVSDRQQLLRATPSLDRSTRQRAGGHWGLRLKSRDMILRCKVSS